MSFVASLYLACLPALFFSCSKTGGPVPNEGQDSYEQVVTKVAVPCSGAEIGINGYDVLVYNADRHGRLDSYMHFEASGGGLKVSSGSGRKKIVVVANAPEGVLQWEKILTLGMLSRQCCSLESESANSPVLVGTVEADAGGNCTVQMNPLTAKICLKELSCDFRGTSYPLEELTDVKVYLTNVNAECSITGDSDAGNRFINNGRMEESDIRKFVRPGIILREVEGNVGMDPVPLDIELLCYPNGTAAESFGKPFTRIVIEGKIKGKTWYWPININPLGDGGIASQDCFNLKVNLRRSGSEDPDTAIELSDGEVKMEVEKWNEKDNCTIIF